MDRLTRERIEELSSRGLGLDKIEFQQLCDLALQSLSQEAVRDEVLSEAAKVCKHVQHNFTGGAPDWQGGCIACAVAIEALKREPNAAGQDRVAGDDQQCLSSGATSRSTPSGESPAPAASIMALLAEARGYLEGLELAERIDTALASSEPAPAAPDVASMVKLLRERAKFLDDIGHEGAVNDAIIMAQAAALLAKLEKAIQRVVETDDFDDLELDDGLWANSARRFLQAALKDRA